MRMDVGDLRISQQARYQRFNLPAIDDVSIQHHAVNIKGAQGEHTGPHHLRYLIESDVGCHGTLSNEYGM